MKIMIFTEGTIIMHKNAIGHSREEIIKQVEETEASVRDYAHYVPIGNAASKILLWKDQGAEIIYLTSRTKSSEIKHIKNVLKEHHFPIGKLVSRQEKEKYKDVAEKIIPDIIIEDDCESIGGKNKMTITYVKNDVRRVIKSIVVKEFGGIDGLPNDFHELK